MAQIFMMMLTEKFLGNLWEIISFKKAHREKHNFSKFPQ
jgi:hypothetical protein